MRSCWNGQLHWRTLAGAGKWFERVAAVVAKVDCKNAIANGVCSGTGGDSGCGLIAGHKVVMTVPIWWQRRAGVSLAGSQSGRDTKVQILKIVEKSLEINGM